jgi:hypothetical protein
LLIESLLRSLAAGGVYRLRRAELLTSTASEPDGMRRTLVKLVYPASWMGGGLRLKICRLLALFAFR